VIVLPLDPLLLSLGPLTIRWGNLLALVGLGLGIWLTLREARALGVARRPMLDALAWAVPVGVLTGRLAHVLEWWDYYLTRPADIWKFSPDGLSLWGGLLGGGLVALAVLGRRRSGRRARSLDAAAPGVALGIAVGRLGMFLDGAGQGLPTGVVWATRYTSPLAATPDFGVPRHPAQVYDGLVVLALFGLMWVLRARLADGWRAWLFVVGYAAARVVLGALRLDPPFVFGLQVEQLIALGCLLVAFVSGARRLIRRAAVQATRVEHARNDSLAA
jgi:phosphatidylglycerol:prolipoprotein diacylglycerol transferase